MIRKYSMCVGHYCYSSSPWTNKIIFISLVKIEKRTVTSYRVFAWTKDLACEVLSSMPGILQTLYKGQSLIIVVVLLLLLSLKIISMNKIFMLISHYL